ncbi:MAG: peptide deformylase, partial [Candidatus Omnitrophica bacterium]|nr:peptide deformylase [Candidatus Omnitrophota bacterium]
MADLKINKFPDPILRSKAAKVTKVTQAEKDMLSDMARTMYLSQGVGLAAVQVGIDKQLPVVDVGDGLIKMVNPVIV